jgi:DHA1 family tetracycline resistance protein-like MFS transporter
VVTSSFWALVFTPISAIGGVTGPALQGMMSRQTPVNQQGELQGINSSLNALAMIITPMVMTTIFAIFTAPTAPIYLPGAPFLLSGVLMVGAVLVFVAGTRARMVAGGQPS